MTTAEARSALQGHYYDDIHDAEEAARVLPERLRNVLALTNVLTTEARRARNTANAFALPWEREAEFLLAHLAVDVEHLQRFILNLES